MNSILPFDNRDGDIWLDGCFVPWPDAQLHVLSHGLHYASCVFEGERVYDGRIFALHQHSQRLIHSAGRLGFSLPYDVETIDAACRDVVARQNIVDGYVRPVAWRGSEMMAISAQNSSIHVAIAAWPWPSYFVPEAQLQGIRLTISQWVRPAPDAAPTDSKAAGLYMICTLSKHAAEAQGYDDALMLDYRGQVAEATGANFFMLRDGVLETPPADCFLDGITRQTVIALARDMGIDVVEKAILPDDLAFAQEAFLTGTAVEITPIREIDQYRLTVGPVTRRLIEAYSALTRSGHSRGDQDQESSPAHSSAA